MKPKSIKPTPEQLASGEYRKTLVMHVESATYASAHISRHDPVKRWEDAGRLSDTQIAAIALVRRLWELAGLSQKVTAHYGEKTPVAGNVELRAANEIEARKDLHRIIDYFTGLEAYWQVFENVVRWGEPAGVAGSRLGFGKRSAQDRAHTIVCFVADMVAMREGI